MSPRTRRFRVGFTTIVSLLCLLLSAPVVQAHGGGGGGHGGGGGGHSGGGRSTSSMGRPGGSHGGGGSSGRSGSNSSWNAPVVADPYDLPSARLHRYMQHLFHHDAKSHA